MIQSSKDNISTEPSEIGSGQFGTVIDGDTAGILCDGHSKRGHSRREAHLFFLKPTIGPDVHCYH